MRARGLGVSRRGKAVLSRVDLDIAAGEIVTLIGPNGAGKSTLVKALLGLIATDAGEVWRRPGLRIGYSPQSVSIDPVLPLSVRRFLDLGGPAGRTEALAALAEVGAEETIDRQVAALSGGELHRVLLARALLRRPELLVLDEPLSGVDVQGQAELYGLIGRLRDRTGAAVLLVSHDLHLVMARTDRVVCIEGHVCCSGHPVEVARDPAFRRLFGDRLGEVVALYRHDMHHHEHAHGHHHHDEDAH
ncbi:MAG TPA: metal ABC transporter ATP-binding protein [Geminicoccaceae bacterium]|nr:metal ABC transporter ATP-binding protein [Geminicoccus sp.]HMU48414.1 metal ABC transporter ATP-binding protein [Geminicoccaceae bacterium]